MGRDVEDSKVSELYYHRISRDGKSSFPPGFSGGLCIAKERCASQFGLDITL